MDYKNVNYSGNSDKNKKTVEKEKPKRDKIVKGGVKAKNKSFGKKFLELFIAEDVGDVKEYVISEVIVPSIKQAVSETVTNAVDMFLYGETRTRKTGSSRNSYTKYYEVGKRASVNSRRNVYDYKTITFDSRQDAEDVLTTMVDIVDEFDAVTVAELYELVGESVRHTDHKYGWKALGSASTSRTKDGYVLKLPKPEAL